ncbi:MAG: helix-turn-helix transcriptional regulator [Bacteriovoracales bacterium]|nr:helix-turn-helix transcriptional regulator [Bacteriovoracales bacterium]
MKKDEFVVYKSVKDFAQGLKISNIEMALAREKGRIIEELKAKRIKKKISQAKLAKLIGSKQPTIARMESGQVSQVSMDFLIKVAIALKTPLSIKVDKAA